MSWIFVVKEWLVFVLLATLYNRVMFPNIIRYITQPDLSKKFWDYWNFFRNNNLICMKMISVDWKMIYLHLCQILNSYFHKFFKEHKLYRVGMFVHCEQTDILLLNRWLYKFLEQRLIYLAVMKVNNFPTYVYQFHSEQIICSKEIQIVSILWPHLGIILNDIGNQYLSVQNR